jgi:hypothetical protein
MICILDNGKAYSEHTVYFVECRNEQEGRALAELTYCDYLGGSTDKWEGETLKAFQLIDTAPEILNEDGTLTETARKLSQETLGEIAEWREKESQRTSVKEGRLTFSRWCHESATKIREYLRDNQ